MRKIKVIIIVLVFVLQGCNTSNAPETTPSPKTATLNPTDRVQVERFLSGLNAASARSISANWYNNQGVKYDIETDYITSLHYHQMALDMRLKFGQLAEAARSYNNMAIVYYMQGDYAQAKELYEKALKLLDADDPWKEHIENNYAILLRMISTRGARALSGPPVEDPPIRLVEGDM